MSSCVKIASIRKWCTLWYSQGQTVPVDTNCRSKGYLWLSQLYDTHWRSAYTWHSQLTCIADEHTCMWDCPSWHTLQINMYVRLSQLTHITDEHTGKWDCPSWHTDQHTRMWDCPSWHTLQINIHVCETVPVDAYSRSTYPYVRLSQLTEIEGQPTPKAWVVPVDTHSRSTYMHEIVPVDAHEYTSLHVCETVPVDACCIWADMYVRLSHLTHILGQHTCMKLSQLMRIADEHACVWDCPSWCTLQMNIHVCETVLVDTHGPADTWDCPIWPIFQVTWHDTVPSETYGKSADMSACPT